MLINYRAFSWTYTPAELQQVLINQMEEMLSRTLNYTEKKLNESDDPDRAEMLEIFESLKALRVSLAAGEESSQEWADLIDWSWSVFEADPMIGGSYGKGTYYARIKDGTLPATISSGKTKVLIDREGIHLDLDINLVI